MFAFVSGGLGGLGGRKAAHGLVILGVVGQIDDDGFGPGYFRSIDLASRILSCSVFNSLRRAMRWWLTALPLQRQSFRLGSLFQALETVLESIPLPLSIVG